MRFQTEPTFPHGTVRPTGVLLINLGTPDEPTPAAVRRYLRQFLSDPRVVEIPRLVWWLILNGIILNTRPKKTAKKYAGIWMKEGSPLRVFTLRQAQMLKGFLGESMKAPLKFAVGMRYGNPSIAEAVQKLKEAHCDNILVLPLYPQYAASTTATAFDELSRVMATIRNVPGIRFVRSFHDHPAYIEAVARNVRAEWMKLGRPDFAKDKLVMSFHGLPKFHLDRGDPYHCQCHKTARLIAAALQLKDGEYLVTFQSRFGRAEWLQPYTEPTLVELGRKGTRRVDIIAPGFAADCLETLEEIAIEGRSAFIGAGGSEYYYLPVANDTQAFVGALATIVQEELGGWVAPSKDDLQREAEVSRVRAKALGGN